MCLWLILFRNLVQTCAKIKFKLFMRRNIHNSQMVFSYILCPLGLVHLVCSTPGIIHFLSVFVVVVVIFKEQYHCSPLLMTFNDIFS